MTERAVQLVLYSRFSRAGHRIFVPNIMLYAGCESDLISVMKSGRVCEFEIKLTVADFKNNHKKRRFNHVGDLMGGPNYFYYVVPTAMVGKVTVPAYAGLIEVVGETNARYVNVVKKPPLRQAEVIGEKTMDKIMTSLSYRFMSRLVADYVDGKENALD